jgi:hypothetical protein
VKLLLILLAIHCAADAASLRGTVRHAETRAPLERVLVRLTTPNGQSFEERTGSDGRYVFSTLPGARFTVQAVAEEFLPLAATTLELAAGDEKRDFDLRLAPELGIVGRVLREPEETVSAVTVEARAKGEAVATDWTDANGVFRLTGLGPGSYEIVATRGITWEPVRRADGGREMFIGTKYEQPVKLEAGQKPPEISILLKRVPVHRVRLKVAGKLATLTPVAAPPPQNPYDITNREIPANGCLVMDDVFAGTYNLIIDGGETKPLTVPGRPGC